MQFCLQLFFPFIMILMIHIEPNSIFVQSRPFSLDSKVVAQISSNEPFDFNGDGLHDLLVINPADQPTSGEDNDSHFYILLNNDRDYRWSFRDDVSPQSELLSQNYKYDLLESSPTDKVVLVADNQLQIISFYDFESGLNDDNFIVHNYELELNGFDQISAIEIADYNLSDQSQELLVFASNGSEHRAFAFSIPVDDTATVLQPVFDFEIAGDTTNVYTADFNGDMIVDLFYETADQWNFRLSSNQNSILDQEAVMRSVPIPEPVVSSVDPLKLNLDEYPFALSVQAEDQSDVCAVFYNNTFFDEGFDPEEQYLEFVSIADANGQGSQPRLFNYKNQQYETGVPLLVLGNPLPDMTPPEEQNPYYLYSITEENGSISTQLEQQFSPPIAYGNNGNLFLHEIETAGDFNNDSITDLVFTALVDRDENTNFITLQVYSESTTSGIGIFEDYD